MFFSSFLSAIFSKCIDPTTALGQCALLAFLRRQLRALRKAEANLNIARMTSTTKHDEEIGKEHNVIASSATGDLLVEPVMRERSLKKQKQIDYTVHEVSMPEQHHFHFRWEPTGSC